MSELAKSYSSVQVAKVGLETAEELSTNPSTFAIPPTPAAQNPAHAPETDPLTAFVASLTADQKAKLAALLLGGRPAG